jgi:hypothetical protein
MNYGFLQQSHRVVQPTSAGFHVPILLLVAAAVVWYPLEMAGFMLLYVAMPEPSF